MCFLVQKRVLKKIVYVLSWKCFIASTKTIIHGKYATNHLQYNFICNLKFLRNVTSEQTFKNQFKREILNSEKKFPCI